MNKPIIAIDIDEVVAQTTEAIRVLANKKHGIDLPPEAYAIKADYWGYYEAVWKHHDVEGVTFAPIHEEILTNHMAVEILPGAEYALQRLSQKYEVVFVTARDDSRGPATLAWFKTWLPSFEPKIYYSNYVDETKRVPKGALCKQLGAEVLIDDNYAHCLSAIESGLKAILFGEYGWQHDFKDHDSLTRCRDWQAVLEYFDAA